MKRTWVQLRSMQKAKVLLILPCNAGACVGNYFQADLYSPGRWNVWREADNKLSDLRKEGLVAFAAVDSSSLETQPGDPRGAIVFETEMSRVRNPQGEDWGAPSWRFFRPSRGGRWGYLEELTEALVKGIRRVQKIYFSQVLALVNPRGYFLALAAAAKKCGVLDRWVLFRVPAHPDHLLPAFGQIITFVRAAASDQELQGGIYPIPTLYPALEREAKTYRDILPERWQEGNLLPGIDEVNKYWTFLAKGAR
jgi:hypothetical protein